PAGDVLAVGGDEVDAALVAEGCHELLRGHPARLPDEITDHQHPDRPRRPRRVTVRRIARPRQADGSAGGLGGGAGHAGLLRVLDRARLADDRDLDLARVGQLLLDLADDVAGEPAGGQVIDLLWPDEDPDLAAG